MSSIKIHVYILRHLPLPMWPICGGVPSSPACEAYVSQLIRYAVAQSARCRFLVRGSRLVGRLMSQRFLRSRLQAAFRKFCEPCGGLVCQCSLLLGQMLSGVFRAGRWALRAGLDFVVCCLPSLRWVWSVGGGCLVLPLIYPASCVCLILWFVFPYVCHFIESIWIP
jgi:hypothetical protein